MLSTLNRNDALRFQEEKPLKLSPFLMAITKIAEEEGDFISEKVLKELEQMVTPDASLRSAMQYASLTGPGFEITDERAETIKTVITVIKGLAEAGGFISEKFGKYLGPIGTAAGVVKDIVEFFQDEKPDPVMKELGELKNQLTALSDKMSVHFNALESFMVKQEFYKNYTVAMTSMMSFMMDTTDGSKESVDLFKKIYDERRPQTLVYDMLAELELDDRNPLKLAMKGDNLQSKNTFKKWKDILEGALSQALFLEVYASGLFPEVGNYGTTKILEKIARYQQLVEEWDYHFWGVEKLVNDVHDDRNLKTKDEKMEVLWKGIESIHTQFKFYAVVVPSEHIIRWYKHFEAQAIVSDRNGFTIMVYRHTGKMVRTMSWLYNYIGEHLHEERSDFMQFNNWQSVRNHFSDDNVAKIGKYTGTFVFIIAQSKSLIALKYSRFLGNKGPGVHTFDATLTTTGGFTIETFPVFKFLGY
ncbi:hypothetical protein GCK72_016266 [Caenorhabditis remanei]|uniref:Uncharacterized protein n=1 Tax=Caenorhabditis remanei TaxID=31234 RepID=A0A6A5GYN2_CAERE|nr:hypothetical protein GCK72_016266 [Caenorhabditis remanei]KAF1759799.1 hypothetical protein GCK72_016266 [Caenorhabditis remanei]